MEDLLGLLGVLVEAGAAEPALNDISTHSICRILCLSSSGVAVLGEMEDQRETDPQGQQGETPLLEALSWEGAVEGAKAEWLPRLPLGAAEEGLLARAQLAAGLLL